MSLCVICQDPIELFPRTRLDPCAHEFHFDCVSRWYAVKKSCPLCVGGSTLDDTARDAVGLKRQSAILLNRQDDAAREDRAKRRVAADAAKARRQKRALLLQSLDAEKDRKSESQAELMLARAHCAVIAKLKKNAKLIDCKDLHSRFIRDEREATDAKRGLEQSIKRAKVAIVDLQGQMKRLGGG